MGLNLKTPEGRSRQISNLALLLSQQKDGRTGEEDDQSNRHQIPEGK